MEIGPKNLIKIHALLYLGVLQVTVSTGKLSFVENSESVSMFTCRHALQFEHLKRKVDGTTPIYWLVAHFIYTSFHWIDPGHAFFLTLQGGAFRLHLNTRGLGNTATSIVQHGEKTTNTRRANPGAFLGALFGL